MPLSPKGQVSIDQIQKPHTPTVLHEPSHLTGTWTGTSPASHSQHLFLFAVILSVCLVALSTVCFVKKCLCLCIFHRLIVFFSVMYILPTISALHPSLILYLPQRPSAVSSTSIIHFHYTNVSLTPLVCSPSAPIFTQAPNSSFTWKIMFKVKLTNSFNTQLDSFDSLCSGTTIPIS